MIVDYDALSLQKERIQVFQKIVGQKKKKSFSKDREERD